jgi:hypothetical protein
MAADRQTSQAADDRANQQRQAARATTDSQTTGSEGAPVHIGSLNARQSAVLRKQQTIGNAAVVRQLRAGMSGTSDVSAGAVQRVPEDGQNTEVPAQTAGSPVTSAGDSGSANTIQREEAVSWTVPASVTPPLQAAQAAAIETEGYAQQLSSSMEMTSAGWSALVGTKLQGSPPAPVQQSGAAARSQSQGVQGSVGKVTGGLDQAKAVLSAAVQQGRDAADGDN